MPHGSSTGQASFGLGPAATLVQIPTALHSAHGPQADFGSVFPATGTHCPGAFAEPQVKQPPAQSVAQQKPSMHMPLAHCRSVPQAWPIARSGAQAPPLGVVAQW